MDSVEPSHVGEMKIIKPDFGNQCCKFNEEIDVKFPEPFMEKIGISIFAFLLVWSIMLTGTKQ